MEKRSRVVVVTAHPNPDSFVHAARATVVGAFEAAGFAVADLDLDSDGFDPVMDRHELRRKMAFDDLVVRYSNAVRDARSLVFVFPDWWGMPPARLKGWLDRVLRSGLAYDHREGADGRLHHVPLLTDYRALVVATTDQPALASVQPTEQVWRNAVGRFVGISDVAFSWFLGVSASSRAARHRWLADLDAFCRAWHAGDATPPTGGIRSTRRHATRTGG